MKKVAILCMVFSFAMLDTSAQTAKDIIRQMDENLRGSQSYSEMTMTIVREDWTREMSMKSWSLEDEFAMILITSPARDKGTAFLKRGKEIWNYQPRIDRSIKLPASMMMQSWMGSDFTNDDLVKQSSLVDDFTHSLLEEEKIEDIVCHVIEMIPNEDADVVWGKIKIWVGKDSFIQMKSQFYDEENYLINTLAGSNVKEIDGRKIATKLTITPEEEPGNQTIIEYLDIDFDERKAESFYSMKNLKRIR